MLKSKKKMYPLYFPAFKGILNKLKETHNNNERIMIQEAGKRIKKKKMFFHGYRLL